MANSYSKKLDANSLASKNSMLINENVLLFYISVSVPC